MDWNLWSGVWTPIGAIATLLGAWFIKSFISWLFSVLQVQIGFQVPNWLSVDKENRCENSLNSLKKTVEDLHGDLKLHLKATQDILVENQKTNRTLEQLLAMMNSQPPMVGEVTAAVQLRLHRPSAAAEVD